MPDITKADEYISQFVIHTEDWNEAESDKKQRMLNVAERTLNDRFPKYHIPNDAIYEFSAKLATVFNDTNVLQTQGVASFSVTGVASFTFKENNVKSAAGRPMYDYIPNEAYSIINNAEENAELPKIGEGLSPRDVVM